MIADHNEQMLSCPFCKHEVDLNDPDTLYPTGMYWREEDGLRQYVGHRSKIDGDRPMWSMHCNETSGGCGCEITAHSKDEAKLKWNTRN